MEKLPIVKHCYSLRLIETNVVFSSYFLSEIARVRASLFQINGVRKEPLQLPDPDGETVTLNEKVYVPVKEHPDVSTIIRTTLFISTKINL
jgi:hypothetical protein